MNRPEPSGATDPEVQPASEPSLARTRALLRVLLILGIVLPVAAFTGYAWVSYEQHNRAAAARVDALSRIATEHALKLFEVNQQLLERVHALVRGRSDEQIRGAEAEFHQTLQRIAVDGSQLSSLNIFSRSGGLLASNRFYPANPNIAIADRPYFIAHRDGFDGIVVSPALRGRALGYRVFNVSSARRGADGRFEGVILVSLRADYLSQYYEVLTDGDRGAAIALFHADGSLIARHPATATEPAQFAAEGGLMQAIATGESDGVMETGPADRAARHVSFRKVGAYPLYLGSSIDRDEWMRDWYGRMAIVAGFTFVPTLALCVLLLVAMRRLRREEAGWTQWRDEVMQRQAMEIAYKQARRLEALGQLTGSVAHDFNNLLMVVSTSTMLLRRRLADREDTEQPLSALERSLDTGKRLTRQLLAFSRKQPLRPEVLDVPAQMREFIELVRASLGSRIRLDLDIDPDTCPVYADEGEFELALLNLAINARDAMPEGGTLTVRAHNERLDAHGPMQLTGEFVAISFADDGHGIDEAHLREVFEPFFTTKAPGLGTGLGLAQVRGFCEQAGGTAVVRSEPGRGTEVRMYLRASIAADTSGEATPPDADMILPHATGRVLLVEDNPDVAQVTRILLEQLGYTVDLATSGDEALARIDRESGWDIVVSDVLMPGRTSGIALAKWLRAHHPDMAVLLITGYTAQLEQAKSEGLLVLAKPFDARSLGRAIEGARMRPSSHPLDAEA